MDMTRLMTKEEVRSVTVDWFNVMTPEQKIHFWRSRIAILEVNVEISESEQLGGNMVSQWNSRIETIRSWIRQEEDKMKRL